MVWGPLLNNDTPYTAGMLSLCCQTSRGHVALLVLSVSCSLGRLPALLFQGRLRAPPHWTYKAFYLINQGKIIKIHNQKQIEKDSVRSRSSRWRQSGHDAVFSDRFDFCNSRIPSQAENWKTRVFCFSCCRREGKEDKVKVRYHITEFLAWEGPL